MPSFTSIVSYATLALAALASAMPTTQANNVAERSLLNGVFSPDQFIEERDTPLDGLLGNVVPRGQANKQLTNILQGSKSKFAGHRAKFQELNKDNCHPDHVQDLCHGIILDLNCLIEEVTGCDGILGIDLHVITDLVVSITLDIVGCLGLVLGVVLDIDLQAVLGICLNVTVTLAALLKLVFDLVDGLCVDVVVSLCPILAVLVQLHATHLVATIFGLSL